MSSKIRTIRRTVRIPTRKITITRTVRVSTRVTRR